MGQPLEETLALAPLNKETFRWIHLLCVAFSTFSFNGFGIVPEIKDAIASCKVLVRYVAERKEIAKVVAEQPTILQKKSFTNQKDSQRYQEQVDEEFRAHAAGMTPLEVEKFERYLLKNSVHPKQKEKDFEGDYGWGKYRRMFKLRQLTRAMKIEENLAIGIDALDIYDRAQREKGVESTRAASIGAKILRNHFNQALVDKITDVVLRTPPASGAIRDYIESMSRPEILAEIGKEYSGLTGDIGVSPTEVAMMLGKAKSLSPNLRPDSAKLELFLDAYISGRHAEIEGVRNPDSVKNWLEGRDYALGLRSETVGGITISYSDPTAKEVPESRVYYLQLAERAGSYFRSIGDNERATKYGRQAKAFRTELEQLYRRLQQGR